MLRAREIVLSEEGRRNSSLCELLPERFYSGSILIDKSIRPWGFGLQQKGEHGILRSIASRNSRWVTESPCGLSDGT